MGSISFLSAVCVVGAVQGVLLMVALQRIEARHRVANRLLSVLLGLIVIALLVRLVRHESSLVPQSWQE
jgi:multisubunit Na+/H+ antiporter MnhB subunit